MSVFKRGQHWHYEFMHAGQVFRKACGKSCKSKTRAVQIEAEARARALNGEQPIGRRKMLTLAEAAKLYLAERESAHTAGNLARNTLRHYRNAWDSWLSSTPLAPMRVNQIAAHHIAAVQFPGGPFTAKNARQCLSAILGWCRDNRLIAAVPRVKGGRVQGRKIRITPEMEHALRQHLDRDSSDVLTVMLDTMMRNCEIFAMEWARIDWALEDYDVAKSKSPASQRKLPLGNRVIAMLKARKDGSASQWVFPSRCTSPAQIAQIKRLLASGTAVHGIARTVGVGRFIVRQVRDGKYRGVVGDVHITTVAKQFQQAREAAGIDPSVKLYCARHTGASELSEMGVDLLTLRTLLGHEDISTTNKYLHGSTDKARDAVDKRNTNRSGLKVVEKRA